MERVEVTLRAEPAAAALDHYRVALLGDLLAEHGHEPVARAVRVALREDRVGPARRRSEHVGAEPGAVAHRHHHVALHDELVGVRAHAVPSATARYLIQYGVLNECLARAGQRVKRWGKGP